MAEKRAEVVTRHFKVTFTCDECGGIMEYLSDPVDSKHAGVTSMFEHSCAGCGRTQFLTRRYPYMDTETQLLT